MPTTLIRCPKCDWEPDESCRWMCSVCRTVWNTFETGAQCPACGKVYEETTCLKRRGGCGQSSAHQDWYTKHQTAIEKPAEKFTWFWQKKNDLPVTDKDKEWIESSLLSLVEMFGQEYFISLPTVTPDKEYFDRDFTGTEADVEFLLQQLTLLMNIDPWEIQLMYYSNKPTQFNGGIVATPQEKLKGGWNSSTGQYVDNGLGSKEIWIETGQLNDPIALIATLAHELAHYKLLAEYGMEENDELLTDLTAIVFGFGIFMGNSYFKFAQWTSARRQGWQMQRRGYLPEQVIAYAMAWLAHYSNEDISWVRYLNKTMKKYFERCYTYIEENADKVLWE